VISRYYDCAAQVLARHGGTIEEFIGDAMMAVYGIPGGTRTTLAVEAMGTHQRCVATIRGTSDTDRERLLCIVLVERAFCAG
jgi:class 3 adenylate cyclase